MGSKARRSSAKHDKGWANLLNVFAAFGLLVLPLILSNAAMDISLVPRMLAWVFFLILISFFFYIGKLHRQLDLFVLKKSVFPIFAIYFIIGLISLLFAENAKAGLFDMFKTFSFGLFLAYSTFIFLNTPDWQDRLARFFIAGTLLILFIGYVQYMHKLGPGIHSRGELMNLQGLMSNVNLYAGYLMILLPVTIYGAIALKRIWRKLAIIALVLGIILIILLQTRSVYLGLMVSVPATGVMLLVFYRQFQMTAKQRNLFAFMMIGLAIFVVGVGILLPDDHMIKSRALSMFTDTENPRILVWETSVRLIADNPLLGVGAGNFHIRMSEYVGASGLGEQGIIWMRPHNDYLWVAAEKGIPGLLSFLLLFLTSFLYGWKMINLDVGWQKKLFALLILMGLMAYMVFSFFDFPLERVNHQIVLAIYLSALVSMLHAKHPSGSAKPKYFPRVVFLPVITILLLAMVYGFNSIRLEKHVKIARAAHDAGDYSAMLKAAGDAKTVWRDFDPIGNPVVLYECLAYMGLNNIPKALEAGEKARQKTPNRRTVLLPLGYIYLSNGQYNEAIQCMTQIVHMYPEDEIAWTMIGGAYHELGDDIKALEALENIPWERRLDETNKLIETIRQEQQVNEQRQ